MYLIDFLDSWLQPINMFIVQSEASGTNHS